MKIIARFLGGPLGGTTREVDSYESPYFVQGYARTNWVISRWDDTAAPTMIEYETEEYRSYYRRPGYIEYSWVNPVKGLREQNAKLRKELELAKGVLEALKAFKTLAAFINDYVKNVKEES